MQVDLYEEELAVLFFLLELEILQAERADVHNQMTEYRLFLFILREKLLKKLELEAIDEQRHGRVSDE